MSIARAAVRSGGENDRDAMLSAGKRAPAEPRNRNGLFARYDVPHLWNVSGIDGNPWTPIKDVARSLVAFTAPHSVTLGSLKDDHTR